MNRVRAFVRVCAVLLCACGDGDDGGEVEQVVDSLAGFCTATFTADHDIMDNFGDVALSVAAGDSFLLSNLGSEPELLYRTNDGVAALELGDAPVDAPCLAEGVTLTSELAAFTDVEVYADETFASVVCTVEQFAHGPVDSFGYGYVDGGYQVFLGGAFCDGLDEAYVRQSMVMLGTTRYIGVPFATLYKLAG